VTDSDAARAAKFAASIDRRLQRAAASTTAITDATHSKLSVIVHACGAKKRSSKLMTNLADALLARGIYTDPDITDLRVPLETWVRFSYEPPTPSEVPGLLFPGEYGLERFIALNAPRIEGLNGIDIIKTQFEVPGGLVDIVGRDRATGQLVAIELKKGAPDQKLVAQLFNYVRALDGTPVAPDGVRGVILTGLPDAKLQEYAEHLAADYGYQVDWYLYRVEMTLERVGGITGRASVDAAAPTATT
jgi:Endonuclease NucS